MIPIYFYLPKKDWPQVMPASIDEPWEEFGRGIYCWTLQTYLHLRQNNYPCQLVDQLPNAGIVLAHRDSLPYELRPNPATLIVCMKADRDPHPYAQVHLVQNSEECKLVKNSYYIPHWPQPGLIPRELSRKHKVENVAYMGLRYNLAPELQSKKWSQDLAKLGLNWQIRPRHLWHDYSNVDIVLAVREFGGNQQHLWKPATKLYNCWHAGVPAVLGVESAFQSERKSSYDYFEVTSAEEAIQILKQLKQDPDLFDKVIRNGTLRSHEKSKDTITKLWQQCIENHLVPQYNKWQDAPTWQQLYYLGSCFARIKLDSLANRLAV